VILLVFPSVHWVLKAEKLLRASGVRLRILSLPESISTDCGMGIEMRETDRDSAEHLLLDVGIPVRVENLGQTGDTV
jgi:hypothetical protein